MNKIEFPRTGVDGEKYTKEDIENWYIGKDNAGIVDPISSKIKSEMQSIHYRRCRKVDSLLREIENNVEQILLSSPEDLLKWTERIDHDFPGVFSTTKKNKTQATNLGKKVYDAFRYDNYRKNKLIDLAKKLNVKCCPYCNMHYTLYAEKGKTRADELTKFQFDHFYAKSKYPMLSMSLYNLIPSCAVCNQGKSDANLSLDYNPYYSNIYKQFSFMVHDPIGLFCGERIKDEIEIDIQQNGVNKNDLDDFIDTFHLKTLYQRHGDIAQETFDKAYEKPYYQQPSNFSWLSNSSPEYIQQLWMGVYPNEKDIEKRPMSKFIQDLWRQASDIKSRIYIEDTNE